MVLPQEVKVKLLFWYVENGRSVAKTQRKFKVHYQRKKAPDRNSILDIVKNMEENGSVGRRTYSERAKTARTPENIRKIKAKMTDCEPAPIPGHAEEVLPPQHQETW